jgi:dihydroorotate dehydrogenase electron transfer subunit
VTLPIITRIQNIQDETRTIRTFVLDMELAEAEPGQFVMLWLPGIDEKPMSIAYPTPLTLTITRLGSFSTALHRAREGDRLGVRGPYGRGFSLHEKRPALMVAGGCGAPPLYFLAARAVEHGAPTTVALGARTALDLLYVERFRALDVDLHLATDDGSLGKKGPVTDLVDQLVEKLESPPAIYTCGPEPMLAALLHFCLRHDLPGQFSIERYMKCGFGICGQCALDGLLICQDGPVLTVDQLKGLSDFGRFRRSATGRRLPIR